MSFLYKWLGWCYPQSDNDVTLLEETNDQTMVEDLDKQIQKYLDNFSLDSAVDHSPRADEKVPLLTLVQQIVDHEEGMSAVQLALQQLLNNERSKKANRSVTNIAKNLIKERENEQYAV